MACALAHPARRRLCWAAALLGVALGGFFDGILLHQILQWHHLLSGVDRVRDMRLQILADGAFHALMYAVAVVALLQLWRTRAAMAETGSARRLGGSVLIGFGTWHVLDAVLSHWVLGIHRIKMDAAQPLLWDLGWFLVFGVLPALLGWRLLRTAGGSGKSGNSTMPVALGLAVWMAGLAAALPPSSVATPQTLVIFAPGTSGAEAFATLARAEARILGSDAAGGVWAVALPASGSRQPFYQHGAIWIRGTTAVALGCISWTQARTL